MPEIDSYTHRERGSSPAASALRGIRERARRRRSGAVALIQVLLYAALVAVIVGGAIGGPALYRAIVGGSEHNTLKGNIDRVSQAADDYWGQYAADRDGRRKIDLVEFCNFANSQFAQGEDIILRTLANVPAATTTLGATTTNLVAVAEDGLADGFATTRTANDGAIATCPTVITSGVATGEIVDATSHDIIVKDGAAVLAAGTTSHVVSATSAATTAGTVSLTDLEVAGLASTRGVWIAQFNGIPAPTGADVAATDLNEVLVMGGIAPDGTSFCLVKVFDADDRADIGDYRVSRQSGPKGGADGTNPFATCNDGTTGITVNTARHNAGWPEAR